MIIFKNKGELDIRAIKTFGVNSKDNPDSAIGYFGTGLKYAIAVLLRNGHEVTIYTGGREYKFGVETSTIRNDEFDIVTMNGQELGFTTSLGKNWKMWMAYRELHSNMLDEPSGTVLKSTLLNVKLTDDVTLVVVTGHEFEAVFDERDKYFLNKELYSPLHTHSEVDAYPKTHNGAYANIFYKGVTVMETRVPALFDYNHHKGLTLTEDRTISNSWSTLYHVSPLVKYSKDKSFIKQMVMAESMTYESQIDFTMGGTDEQGCAFFFDVVGKLRKKYKDRGINPTAIALHQKWRGTTSVMPGISCSLTPVQKMQLDKAKRFCTQTLGLDVDDYKLIVCKDLANDLGQADIENGIMYISKKCFSQGTKRVAVAILEEYTHCKHEVLDETLEQKWVYLEQIISLGETIDGEPL